MNFPSRYELTLLSLAQHPDWSSHHTATTITDHNHNHYNHDDYHYLEHNHHHLDYNENRDLRHVQRHISLVCFIFNSHKILLITIYKKTRIPTTMPPYATFHLPLSFHHYFSQQTMNELEHP